MTTEFNIIKYNKEKAQERRKKIVEQICVYQKNATHAGDILRELWDISYIKNAVNHTVCSTYKLYGMCELAPVYEDLSEADLYADAFIGFEEAVMSFDTEKAKMEDENSDIKVFVAYCIPFIKSAIVCRILDESHHTYKNASRRYQNELVQTKKAGVLLQQDSNDEIRAAIKDRYGTEWSDTIINNLRDVYTVEDTFDNYHKKTVNSPEFDISKMSADVFATLEKILRDNGATSNEMKVFHKWTDLAMKDNRAVPTKERLVFRNELTASEMTVFKAQKKLLRDKLPAYLGKFDVDMLFGTTRKKSGRKKKNTVKKSAVVYKFPEPTLDTIPLVAEM